jgi:hypothetical protein
VGVIVLKGKMQKLVPDHLKKYFNQFIEHMRQVDDVALTVLKGHLLIEGIIDNILEVFFFHPEQLQSARLTFFQKVALARAYALRKNKDSVWDLVLAINELRNATAHELAGEKRQRKLEEVRRLYIAGALSEATKRPGIEDKELVEFACADCVGYLGTYEHDVRALRAHIDAFDAILNPDKDRVRLK